IFLGWTFYLMFIYKGNVEFYQLQENVIKAEKYLYSDSAIKNVIVGTSLSCGLDQDSVPDIYKLAFSGEGIFEGLDAIEHSKVLPKNVFIEMNVVYRTESPQVKEELFSPFVFYPKKYLVSLRSDREPLPVLGNSVLSPLFEKVYWRTLMTFRSLKKVTASIFSSSPDKVSATKKDTAINTGVIPDKLSANAGLAIAKKKDGGSDSLRRKMDMEKGQFANVADSLEMSNQFETLKEYVDFLKSKGVNVIFFELPINRTIVNSNLSVQIRKTFYKVFPPKENNYIYLPPDYMDYLTGDGFHLTPTEFHKYSGYFRAEAKKQMK
ncbi:MAG TPA: hypothetical protein VN922_07665, partial [Bacteroidia bacterium]|nr:hypothetical protein [Bacteroidia bacterium]